MTLLHAISRVWHRYHLAGFWLVCWVGRIYFVCYLGTAVHEMKWISGNTALITKSKLVPQTQIPLDTTRKLHLWCSMSCLDWSLNNEITALVQVITPALRIRAPLSSKNLSFLKPALDTNVQSFGFSFYVRKFIEFKTVETAIKLREA